MIRRCRDEDLDEICKTINDGARAYIGVVPSHCLQDPYISRQTLLAELADGVEFWAYVDRSRIKGVMGLQKVQDVHLIRHAYVCISEQRRGVGAQLLQHLRVNAGGPILVGTWANASWAINFYRKHGFVEVGLDQKDLLLRRYWNVPSRQIEASLVLADASVAARLS